MLPDFASDNTAGAHPHVLEVLAQANRGRQPSYGADDWTARAIGRFRDHLGPQAEVHLVWNGTAANVLGLRAVLQRHEAVLCSSRSHLYEDETGAPEAFLGCKLIPLSPTHGKLHRLQLEPWATGLRDIHRVVPRVLSLTQTTEYGTLYTPDELRDLADWAHRHHLLLHLDGARLSNAAAALDVPLRALTTDAGVDILSFGGTKNGLLGAEAVVFLTPGLAPHFGYLHKQGMHLSSKMRFLAAQFVAFFDDDLWLHNARHANAMAQRLGRALSGLPNLAFTHPVQANAVFASLPPASIERLQQQAHFHVWDPALNEVRWMTAWDSPPDDVDHFARAVQAELGR